MITLPTRLLPATKRALLVLPATLAVLTFSACSPKAESKAEDMKSAAAEMAADTKAALSSAWDSTKDFAFEKRSDFEASARAMSAQLDGEISELRADYSEAKADASRRAAIDELKDSRADLDDKLSALGNATAATWDAAKRDVIAAWDRTQAAYHKARAND
ncbi:MAG TPA: hypothetical protein VGD88_03610 [Opitutaceae bacterium]